MPNHQRAPGPFTASRRGRCPRRPCKYGTVAAILSRPRRPRFDFHLRRGSTVRVRQRALGFLLLRPVPLSGWQPPQTLASTQSVHECPPWPLSGAQLVEQADRRSRCRHGARRWAVPIGRWRSIASSAIACSGTARRLGSASECIPGRLSVVGSDGLGRSATDVPRGRAPRRR